MASISLRKGTTLLTLLPVFLLAGSGAGYFFICLLYLAININMVFLD